MTNEHLTSNQPTTNPWDGDNVIAVSFEDDHEAYHALSLLKELDSQQRMGVQEAIVVVRGDDGQLVEKDGTQSEYLAGAASGGLIGLLLGIIGGPLGVLIGGATGQRLGSLYDLADYEDTDSAPGAISSSVQAGRTALLADVVEQSPEVVDAAMSGVGGTVLRRPVAEVEAEIAIAEKAESKATARSTQSVDPFAPRARQSGRECKGRGAEGQGSPRPAHLRGQRLKGAQPQRGSHEHQQDKRAVRRDARPDQGQVPGDGEKGRDR